MTPRHLTCLITALTLMLGGAKAYGQAPGAPNPVLEAGVMIEPIQGKGGPESKFTNSTDTEIEIHYGKDKFVIRPGDTKMIPIPQQQLTHLKIFVRSPADGLLTPLLDGYETPHPQKRFIPIPWTKPNKKEVAQQTVVGNRHNDFNSLRSGRLERGCLHI